MRNLSRSIFVLLALSLFSAVSPARAQDAAKKTKTPAEAVLEAWNDVGNRLITMAEDWPEEKYTYKLTPNVRSFQEVLLHIAGSNYDFLNQVANTKLGEASNDPPSPITKRKPPRSNILRNQSPTVPR
jgi:DinB family